MYYLNIIIAVLLLPIGIFAQIEAPSLMSPSNRAYDESILPVFSWEHPSGAASFTIQLSKSDSFSPLVVEESNITKKFFVLNDYLERSEKYYFRVMAETEEDQSEWSSTNVFYTYNDVGFLSQINSDDNILSTSIITDDAGNIYLTGSFDGTAEFGNDISLTSNGRSDIFVAKYNSLGQCQWATGFGGIRNDQAQDISLDDDGNIFIVGTFYETVLFGQTELQSNGFNDIFLSKLDPTGTALWAIKAGGSFFDKGNALVLDSQGSIYITGEFSMIAFFESTSITSNGSTDGFIAKYNSIGELLWTLGFGSSGADNGYNIELESNEEPVIIGAFVNEVDFSNDVILTSQYNSTTNRYSSDMFLAQYNQVGECQWAVSGGGTGNDFGYSLFIDENDNIYSTGKFEGTANFGDMQTSSYGASDIFVAKYNLNDDWLFAVSAGGEDNDNSSSIALDDNNIYITGYFASTSIFGELSITSIGDNDAFFAKLDKETGDFINALRGGGEEYDAGWAITVNASGSVYSCGHFIGVADFGQFNSIDSDSRNAFIINPFSESDFQAIYLEKGWNLISTNMNPKNRLISNIFKRNIGDILIVKNSTGDTYVPSLGINSIQDWKQDEAYQVYSLNKLNLIIDGTQLIPSDVTINLDQGWSFIPYLLNSQMSISNIFSDIEDNVLLVKSINGSIYFPSLNINNIINMIAGQGYKIYMLENDQLIYPNE